MGCQGKNGCAAAVHWLKRERILPAYFPDKLSLLLPGEKRVVGIYPATPANGAVTVAIPGW